MAIREIVDGAKKERNPVAKILEERKSEAEQEYEETKIRRLLEEEKARILELQGKGRPLDKGLATGFTSNIFQLAQVDPAKAKAFLESLDEENMNKIAYLMAMENDRTTSFLQLAKSSGTNVKDLIEIAKLMKDNGSTDLKGVAEIFKAGVEAAKANNPQGPDSIERGVDHIMKTYVNPFIETLKERDRDIIDAKLEAIKASMPPSPQQYIEGIRAGAQQLGLTSAGEKSAYDLKLEEMRQSHDIDMEKLRWEQQKFVLMQSAERDKWGAISQMLTPITAMAGPEVRNQLRNWGRQVSRDLQSNPSPHGAQTETPVANFVCPQCSAQLNVPLDQIPEGSEEVPIKCPSCGTITPARLEKKKELPPAPPEEKPQRRTRLEPTYT